MPVVFDADMLKFRLINKHKPNFLNCFMNAILQSIWNIDSLKTSVDMFYKQSGDLLKPTAESKLLLIIRDLF